MALGLPVATQNEKFHGRATATTEKGLGEIDKFNILTNYVDRVMNGESTSQLYWHLQNPDNPIPPKDPKQTQGWQGAVVLILVEKLN